MNPDSEQPYIFEDFWTGYPTGLLDIFKPAAQQFYWSQYRDRIKEGMSGWWLDLGEPESVNDSLQFSKGAYDLITFTTSRKRHKDRITIVGDHVTSRKINFRLQVMGKQIESVRFSDKRDYKIMGTSSVDFLWTGKPVSLTIKTF